MEIHRHIGCLGGGGMFALIVSGAGQKPWRLQMLTSLHHCCSGRRLTRRIHARVSWLLS